MALKRAWDAIRQEVAEEFAWLYGTKCDSCGGPATIQYTVWSDVLACPKCEAEIVLWDVAVVRAETRTGFDPPLSGPTLGLQPILVSAAPKKKDGKARAGGDILDTFKCPGCAAELAKTKCSFLRSAPVLTSYECDGTCRPKRRERALTQRERDRIAEIANRPIPYTVPKTPFDERREMWRGVHRDQGIIRIRDFWTPRNLWAIASLWSRASAVEDERLARALRFVVTSTMLNVSKMYKFRGDRKGGS